jgi:hypothetical protein
MNEFKDKFSYNFKTAISEGRNVTGNADAGVAITGKVSCCLWSFSRDGPILKEIL